MTGYILKEGAKIRQKNVKMWVNGITGFAYQDEQAARYAAAKGCICECGKEYDGVMYTACPECRAKHDTERYNKMPFEKWDGKKPLAIYRGDDFFFSIDDIEDYCIEFDCKPEDLMIVICEKQDVPYFDLSDFLEGVLAEDHDAYELSYKNISAETMEKNVNEWLQGCSPISWVPGNKRTSVTLSSEDKS